MSSPPQGPDPQIVKDLISVTMPFGKYEGRTLCDLPMSYLEWFQKKGFPTGRLGMQLATLYEIKLNGLEGLLAEMRRRLLP